MSTPHPIATRDAWNTARRELLQREKAFTRQRDQLSERRRALPWVRVERDYTFQAAGGARSFAELFQGRSQLVVYHLMFAPERDGACTNCTFWADNFERNGVHLAQGDVSLDAISRAPLEKLGAYARRVGWSFPWLSTGQSSFVYDEYQKNAEAPSCALSV
jgi:predicted dithiol-disulfide oxidoreductase (DUF899 family)